MQKTIRIIMLSEDNTSSARCSDLEDYRIKVHLGYLYSTADTGNMSDSYSNSSSDSIDREIEYAIALRLWQVCPVILFIFGTLGNVLILLMMRTLRLGRTSMHIYLRALAVSDLCVLYSGLLRQWLFWTFRVDIRDAHDFTCKTHTWFLHVSLYCSAWLLVVMTLERACSACLPHRVSTFCTKRRALLVVVLIVSFQVVMQGHFLVGLTLEAKVENETKCIAFHENYNYFIEKVLPIIDLGLLSLLPFIFVIAGNVVIVWKTFLSLKTAAEMNLTSGKSALLRRRRASTMTVILLALSALFLLTTSPTCVFNIWEILAEQLTTSKFKAKYELAWALVNIVMYCNNTLNFYLYCLSGRKFRNELRRQFSNRRNDSQSNALSGPSVQLHRFPHNDYKSSAAGGEHRNGLSRQLSYQSSYYGRPSNAYL